MKITLKAIAAHTYQPAGHQPNPHRFNGVVQAADAWARKHPNPLSFRRRKPYAPNPDRPGDPR